VQQIRRDGKRSRKGRKQEGGKRVEGKEEWEGGGEGKERGKGRFWKPPLTGKLNTPMIQTNEVLYIQVK
jgi:hypothetical protein